MQRTKTRRPLWVLSVVVTAIAVLATAGCAGGADGDANGKVTIEFAQWWEPELPDGALADLIDEFEAANPDIDVKLISNPYSSTEQQIFANAAAGQLPDVVGLDGTWVNQLATQGVLADLDQLMDDAGYDSDELIDQIKVDGKTYSVPVVSFAYTLFTNDALLAEAGIDSPPTTRSEFAAAAQAVATTTDADGWSFPLSLSGPSGIPIGVMPWVWASGGSMLTPDGGPDVTNEDVTSAIEYIKGLYDSGAVAPGAFALQQPDMTQNFINGKAAMMFDVLAHVSQVREGNPDLKFSVSGVPVEDGFTGSGGIPYSAWGVGVSANSEHQAEAWRLLSFLLSKDVNGTLATAANGFPGNKNAVPDLDGQDALVQKGFEIYQAGTPVNEFSGLPQGQELQRVFTENLQSALDGKVSIDEALQSVQDSWSKVF